MDKVYTLTKKGKRVCKDGSLNGTEGKILGYIRENKSASEDQLEIAGGEGWLLRSLKRHGYIKEVGE